MNAIPAVSAKPTELKNENGADSAAIAADDQPLNAATRAALRIDLARSRADANSRRCAEVSGSSEFVDVSL